MMFDALKFLVIMVAILFLASIERVLGLPGVYLLGLWWWVLRLPVGWARIGVLLGAGLWLAICFNLALVLGVGIVASWYLALSFLPSQANWQTLRLCLILAIWMLGIAILGKISWSWLSMGYILLVIGMVVVMSRVIIIWDQRLQLSAWWKYLHH